MNNKETKNKEYRIVIAGMDKKVYDKVKKLADENCRTIGKQAEYMLAKAKVTSVK
jgi:hypothetical protein